MTSFLDPLIGRTPDGWMLASARTGRPLAAALETAFDSGGRRKGLLGRDGLAPNSALILAPCAAVHTFFMRFPIDVLFVARNGRVVKAVPALPPWRIAFAVRAFAAIELPAGTLSCRPVAAGDCVGVVRAPAEAGTNPAP